MTEQENRGLPEGTDKYCRKTYNVLLTAEDVDKSYKPPKPINAKKE